MKILELRCKNLNSLYGEWFIDFTDPEYVSNGIFALTGPTGAGKSTILDAVCLALYGATPRLGRITKTSNEIMSRQTGECFAEVLFESQAGRFRCHWSQHRARRKPNGNLADAKHEISDARTQIPIETQKSLVPKVIEEKTGMDFDRFTRSILLAQGGFDTFLKADVEQKSKILEQITGTQIYTQISLGVHERRTQEQDKRKLLEAETAGIVILDPEQKKQIQQELAEKTTRETGLAARLNQNNQAIAWLTGMQDLKKEITVLSEESEKLIAEMIRFKPDRDRLNAAVKAAELDGSHATVTAVRKQQDADQNALKAEEDRLPDLASKAEHTARVLEKASHQVVDAKKEVKTAAPLLQQVRAIDQQLTDKNQAVKHEAASCKVDADQIRADEKQKIQVQKKRKTAQNKLNQVLTYLKTNAADEWLVGGFAGIEASLDNLVTLQKEMDVKKTGEVEAKKILKAAEHGQADAVIQQDARKKELAEVQTRLDHKKKALASLLGERLLREYRTEKETLWQKMAFQKKIADLEAHRSELEDGRPCPLCGAKDHPFAKGNIPRVDDTRKQIDGLTRLIDRADTLESDIKKLESSYAQAVKALNACEKQAYEADQEQLHAKKNLTGIAKDLTAAYLRFKGLTQSALEKLQPLGIRDLPDADVTALLTSLTQRLSRWQDHLEKKARMEKQLSELDSEQKRLDAVIDTRTRALAQKQAVLETATNDCRALEARRRKLFGSKHPDMEETRLGRDVTAAELAEKKARTAHDAARQKWDAAKAHIASLKERIENRGAELKQLEAAFKNQVQAIGFSDENQFLAAVLPAPERHQLFKQAKALDDRHTDLTARQKDREKRLFAETAKKITDAALEDLEPARSALEAELKQLWDQMAGHRHKLAENQTAAARLKEKQAAIDARKKECRRWEKLHHLIGSSDGKKFRNFAQGLTFELMVSHANRQLEKMTDRYLLIRDDRRPLELNVVDNYQAGEIRSTRNLSGGESFIVSLTLALGLSKMASRKVRVDSLFLDEGFGTLDEEALETALETLSGLHQDGKLIGVISHVPALRERIRSQIIVTPASGGKSTLAGPGCRQVFFSAQA
jgi:DNA repair protein SbcC/Rad50